MVMMITETQARDKRKFNLNMPTETVTKRFFMCQLQYEMARVQ